MISSAVVFIFTSISATAIAPTALNSYLNQPIDQRVKLFKACQRECENFLLQVAFDPKAGLQPRWRALTTLGRMDGASYVVHTERALKSKEWYMRNAALIALQTSTYEMAVKWSMQLLTDPALVVRTQAARNLVRLNATEAEPLLWREIFSKRNFHGRESLWVRAHMAEALAHFATPGRGKQFQKLLLEPDTRLHKWAVMGLENSSGFKMTTNDEPVEIRRQKWLARMGVPGS